jgi:hypothetical protein
MNRWRDRMSAPSARVAMLFPVSCVTAGGGGSSFSGITGTLGPPVDARAGHGAVPGCSYAPDDATRGQIQGVAELWVPFEESIAIGW